MAYMGPSSVQGPGPGPQSPRSAPEHPHRRRGYRSVFWAVVLIAAGALWLLSDLGHLTDANIAMLSVLWPILVIGIGLDILLGRRSIVLGALIGAVTVGLIVVLMFVGPGLGWADNAQVKTQSFTARVGQAESARLDVETGRYSASVHALPAGTGSERPLLSATVSYSGSVQYQETSGPRSTVTLQAGGRRWALDWLHASDLKPWDVGIDPSVSLSLKVGSSSGSLSVDASSLHLSDLEVDVSSGDATVSLPAGGGQPYTVRLQLSSGELKAQAATGVNADMTMELSSGSASLTLGSDSDVRLAFKGSSGDFRLQLASGQACRVEVRHVSSGDVHKPSGLVQVTKGAGKEGVWETAGYDAAAHKTTVTIELSSGNVTIDR